jgi:hypothetical protein
MSCTPAIFLPHCIRERAYFGPDSENNIIKGSEYIKKLEQLTKQANGTIIWLDLGKNCEKTTKDYISTLKLGKIAYDKNLIKKNSKFINITEGLEKSCFLSANQINTLSENDYASLPKLGISSYNSIIKNGLDELHYKFGCKADYVVCQFGAGILYNETKEFLRIHSPNTKIIPVAVGDSNSCADKIQPSYWATNPQSLRFGGITTSRHDNSTIYGVEDWELGRTMSELKTQINGEISGFAGLTILPRLEQIFPNLDRKRNTILTINTGNGILNFK